MSELISRSLSQVSGGVLKTFLRATVYYVAIFLIVQTIVTLNFSLYPSVPLAYVIAIPLVIIWTRTLNDRWSAYGLSEWTEIGGSVAVYVVSAAVLCLAIYIVEGKLFAVVSVLPQASEQLSRTWQVTSSLFTAAFAAFVEEVAFRGILQGNLVKVLGHRVAISTSCIIFCALHTWRPGFLSQLSFYMTLAITTALIAAATKSALPGILIHFAVNMILTIMVLATGQIHLSNLPVSLVYLGACMAIISVLGLWISIGKIRRRT